MSLRCKMKIYGLTGSSGAGKSTAAAYFLRHDFGCVDADAVYRRLCVAGSTLLHELQMAFGDILNRDGTLNRPALADIVFSDAEKLKKLNAITCSHIWDASQREFEKLERRGTHQILFDAPTLFQVGLNVHCNSVIGVIAPREVRIVRIMARDGITEQAASARIDAQPDSDFYRKHCDFIMENNGDNQALMTQVDTLCQALNQNNQ